MDEEDKRINLVSHAADGFAYFFPAPFSAVAVSALAEMGFDFHSCDFGDRLAGPRHSLARFSFLYS